jgi:hypothetical protein
MVLLLSSVLKKPVASLKKVRDRLVGKLCLKRGWEKG